MNTSSGSHEECSDGAERTEVQLVKVQHLREGEGAQVNERSQVSSVTQ